MLGAAQLSFPGRSQRLRFGEPPETRDYWVAFVPPPGVLTSESVPINICTNLCVRLELVGEGDPQPV